MRQKCRPCRLRGLRLTPRVKLVVNMYRELLLYRSCTKKLPRLKPVNRRFDVGILKDWLPTEKVISRGLWTRVQFPSDPPLKRVWLGFMLGRTLFYILEWFFKGMVEQAPTPSSMAVSVLRELKVPQSSRIVVALKNHRFSLLLLAWLTSQRKNNDLLFLLAHPSDPPFLEFDLAFWLGHALICLWKWFCRVWCNKRQHLQEWWCCHFGNWRFPSQVA